jgi:methionyl-tRNA synthetase
MPEAAKKFYLTTPIYYVNARPHIGHAYSTIAADVIARRHRLLGDDTFFLTGTDEHGQKVQRSAAAAGIPPQQFADEVSASFRNLWKRMGLTNDDFIRTTDARHKRGVQRLWRTLEERGAIYLSSYTGAYCVSDEAFVDLPAGTPCPDCGRPLETVTEENYFFRLSDYQLPIVDLIESGALHIQPETVRNEVLSFLRGPFTPFLDEFMAERVKQGKELPGVYSSEDIRAALVAGRLTGDLRISSKGFLYVPGALKDLSISRTTFDWGIPVPTSAADTEGHGFSRAENSRAEGASALPKAVLPDAAAKSGHVVYVWLDALANYITAIGYGSDDSAEQAKFARYWPADIHLVGKEITRFHCVYWPAFLLAAGLPLPKSIVANGWLLFEESKMSKSRGNVVRTETILDAFGPLCPPVPNDPPVLLKGTASAVPQTAPLDAAALAAEVTSAAPGSSGGSRGLQPPESTPKAEGALAPGLTPPTKAQQDLFAADILRYFLLREIPFGQDGSFSFDALITRYNADLANGYGNLVSRTLSMIQKYFDGQIGTPGSAVQREIFPIGSNLIADKGLSFDPENLTQTIKSIMYYVAALDGFITDKTPWKLAAKPDAGSRQDLDFMLYQIAESIRIITALLYPILPYATASVWQQLGLGSIEQAARNGELKDLQWGGLKPGTKLGPLAPIFPRADKGLAQIMTDMENPTSSAPELAATPPEPAEASSIPTPEALNAVHPAAVETPAVAASTNNQQPATNNPSPISIDDFAKVDLRVAQIVVAERIPKADKLLRLEVDLGPNFPRRQILAGIAEHYAPESLIGRKVVIVANLAPRKMRGLESQGMVVAASIGPEGAPVLAGFLEDVELGARLK